MNMEVLINGYQHILHTIYAPKPYYERIRTFLTEYKPNQRSVPRIKIESYLIKGFMEATFLLGIRDKARMYYWKLIFFTLANYPRLIGFAINLAVQGFHFRKVYEKVSTIKIDKALLARQTEVLKGPAS